MIFELLFLVGFGWASDLGVAVFCIRLLFLLLSHIII